MLKHHTNHIDFAVPKARMTRFCRVIRHSLATTLVLGFAACAAPASDGEDGQAGDSGGDGDGDGDSAPPAYLVVNRISTPEGRALFVSTIPELNHGEIDIGRALEIGGFSRVASFGGKFYVFDNESGVVTRYAVDDDLSVTVDALSDGEPARLSFSGIGIQSFSNTIAFVADDRAIYVDVNEDLIVEWDPSAMTITSSVDGGILREGLTPESTRPALLDNHLVFPLAWSNSLTFDFVPLVSLAVIDLGASNNRPTIIDDDRCYGAGNVVVDNGAVYTLGENFDGLGITVLDEPLPPPCVLRWRPGQADFDDDYYVDLAARTNSEIVTRAAGLGDGTVLTHIYVGQDDPREVNPLALVSGDFWRYAIVELEGEGVTMVEDLPPSGLSPVLWAVDDSYYAPLTDRINGAASLHRLDGSGQATQVLTSTGDLFEVARLR